MLREDQTPCLLRPVLAPFLHGGRPDGEGNFDLGIEKGRLKLFWRMGHFKEMRPEVRESASGHM